MFYVGNIYVKATINDTRKYSERVERKGIRKGKLSERAISKLQVVSSGGVERRTMEGENHSKFKESECRGPNSITGNKTRHWIGTPTERMQGRGPKTGWISKIERNEKWRVSDSITYGNEAYGHQVRTGRRKTTVEVHISARGERMLQSTNTMRLQTIACKRGILTSFLKISMFQCCSFFRKRFKTVQTKLSQKNI